MREPTTGVGCGLALLVAALAAHAAATSLPSLMLTATSAYDIGQRTREGVQLWVRSDAPALERWAAGHRGQWEALLRANVERFPRVADELRGVAAGAGLGNDTALFLMAMSPEIRALVSEAEAVPEGCSDVLSRRGGAFLAHNEDWDAQYKNWSYMVTARQQHLGGLQVSSLAYPAYPYGFTFGWSSAGVALSCNALGPAGITARAGLLARYFINRDALDASNCSDALARIRSHVQGPGAAYGFAVSVACLWTNRLYNLEIAGKSVDEVEVGKDQWLWHVNMYNRLNGSSFPQVVGKSAQHRAARFRQFAAPWGARDVAAMLGDQGDREYPIYRDARAPDTGVTVATALFDLGEGSVMLYVDSPAAWQPATVVQLPRAPRAGACAWEIATWSLVGVCAALLVCCGVLALRLCLARDVVHSYRPVPVDS
eukprot:m51a1_g8876 hypothetical protein (428) ;mRNA; f:624743-626561